MNFKQSKQKEGNKRITYKSFIAGALLKFESIDSIDLSLLVKNFQEKTNIDVEGVRYNVYDIGKYIKIEKNTISLRDNITLDYFIVEENRPLREKLIEIAGNTVNNYFEEINVKSYQHKKANEFQNNKDKILNCANVLLISESKKDYDDLVKYGFQNIDYFKSLIRADQYFSKYPERLNKYHIVFQGRTSIYNCCYYGNVELENTIKNLRNTKHIIGTSLYKYNYSDRAEFGTHLSDNLRELNTEESSNTAIFDRIIEDALMNRTLFDKTPSSEIPAYFDYINPTRLPLPNTKSKLKILYLDSVNVNKYAPDIAKNLGLDVTFKEDNNSSLGKYVKSHLGDYDIIIVSNLYSNSLLAMDIESTEQCKDTGRDLTLLVSYDSDAIWQFDEDDISDYQGIGSKITLYYKFAGNFAPNTKHHQKEFRVLRKSSEFIHEDEIHKKDYENDVTCITGILGASINIYNDALLQNNIPSINDLDIKTAEEFDNEYEILDKQEEKRINSALAPIREFDSIRFAVSSYLDYKRKGLIAQIPKGLKITEGENVIKIENIYQGRSLCAVTFSKDYKQKNLRIFEIQTMSKKGTLSSPQTIGLYTRKYENLENIPSRPDESQANILLSIKKKINVALRPLNNQALKNYDELEEQKRLLLERKNQTNK